MYGGTHIYSSMYRQFGPKRRSPWEQRIKYYNFYDKLEYTTLRVVCKNNNGMEVSIFVALHTGSLDLKDFSVSKELVIIFFIIQDYPQYM